jgi:phosphatidylinositol alpha-mannosyltransferase
MRITVVSFYLPPTDRIGAGVQMHMLANAYCDLGHDVTVVAPCSLKDSTAKYSLKTLTVNGSGRVLKWALSLAKHKFESDIVHFGGDDHLVRYNRNHVHIRTYHGSCFAEAIVAASVRDKIRMLYLGCTEFISQRQFKVNTTVSTHTNNYFLRPNVVIPNGVDLSKFVPSDFKSINPSILFIGTLDSRKRGRHLIEAFSKTVRKDIPNAELWIVRDNTELQIPGVTVFGAVPESKLIELYQQAWVFCLPSSYEGFGVPYIEAMACGTPVVATPNAGALEVLDGGRYGVLTDINRLGTTLVTLLSDDKRRADLTILGLDRACSYDIHQIAQKYIDLAGDFAKIRVGR